MEAMSGHAEMVSNDFVTNTIEYSSAFTGMLFFVFILFLLPFGYVREYSVEKQNEGSLSHGGH